MGLVVKTAIRSGCTEDRMRTTEAIENMLQGYPDRKCKIYLLHGRLSEEEKNSLYCNERVKALVTLSHGEGFGLPIFEAACNGLPIIAPNWSGHVDFLNHEVEDSKGKVKRKALFSKVDYELGTVPQASYWEGVITKDSKWCYPKKNSYKQKLREVYKNYGMKKSIAKKLQEKVLQNHDSEKQYNLFHDEVLGEAFTSVDSGDLPKISIITSVYDGDKYIKHFMSEITKQSVFKDKCELILVNANSPGNEGVVIEEYLNELDNDLSIYKSINISNLNIDSIENMIDFYN